MARPLDASKQRRWLDLMRLWQQSQLTVRAFCDRHRLSEPNFYVWRRLLRQRGLLPVRPATPAPTRGVPARTAFVQVTLPAEPPAVAIEVILANRRLLRVPAGFDPATLLRLVRLLEEPAC
jgi:transposase-like protein